MGLAYKNDGPFTMTSGEALVADRLVLASSSTAKYADGGEEPIGITTQPVASGAQVACECLDGRIHKVTASKSISANAAIYVTTDGKVSDAAVGKQIGIALQAATADGGKIAAIVWGPRGGNDALSARGRNIEYWEDFFAYDNTATVGDYVEVSDSGTIVTTDAAGGVLSLPTGGTAQNESYVSSMHELFKFDTDAMLWFEARVKLTEANTDDANIIVGLSDTVAADSLLDAGAGPMASYDGAVFFKVFDGTVWQFESSNAAGQDTEISVGAFTDGAWTTLGFLYDYKDGVTASITPFVNGVAGTAVDLTIAGLAEMHILLGAKAGAGNAETLLVDYVHVVTER